MKLDGLRVALYSFQRAGVEWLWSNPRALLADDVGTGKTIQALALLTALRNSPRHALRALVLVPPIALGQWCRELYLKTDLNHLVIQGPPKKRVALWKEAYKYPVTVLPYSLLLRDEESAARVRYNVIIADEASAFKNHRCQTAEAVRRLSCEPDRFIAMTATPLETNALELFSIFRCVEPTLLGSYNRFCGAHVVFKDVRVVVGKRTRWLKVPSGSRNLEELKERVSPLYLRRTLSEVGHELPPTIITPLWLDLKPKQQKRMAEAREGTLQMPEGQSRQDVHIRMLRQMQICDSLRCLTPKTKAWGESVKLDALVELLEGELANEQVVVFARFRTFLEQARDVLWKRGHSVGIITSHVDKKRREELLERHRTGDLRLLLMTTAGERALNLQHCSYMVMLNLLYNPARNRQLIGRIRRLGQARTTVVIPMLIRDSIEEDLLDVLSARVNMVREALGFEAEVWKVLTPEELTALMRGEWRPVMASEGDQRVREAFL